MKAAPPKATAPKKDDSPAPAVANGDAPLGGQEKPRGRGQGSQQRGDGPRRGGASGARGGGARGGRGGARGPPPPTANEAKYQTQIEAATKQISSAKSKLEKVSATLKTREQARGEVKREINGIKTQLREVGGKLRKIFEQKKVYQGKIKGVSEQRNKREKEINDAKAALPLKRVSDSLEQNLKQIDDEIKRIEISIETTTQSLKEEKDKLSQISQLNRQKDEVRAYHVLRDQVTGDADTSAWNAELRALEKQIAVLKQQESELSGKISELHAKISADDSGVGNLIAERNTLAKQVDEAYASKREAVKALGAEKKAAFEARKAAAIAREAARAEEDARRAAEVKAREAEKAQAELLKVPFEEELLACDELLAYLAPLRLNTAATSSTAKTSASSSSASTSNASTATTNENTIAKAAAEAAESHGNANVTVINRAAEGANKKKKGGKRNTKKKAPGSLLHRIEAVALFAKMGVAAPATAAEVETVQLAVRAKKAEFQKKSAAAMAEKQAKAKEAIAAAEKEAAENAAKAAAAAKQDGEEAAATEGDDDLLDAFKNLDKDGSGKLSRAELSTVMANMDAFDTQEKIDAVLAKADADGDGLIDYAEFVALVKAGLD